MSYFYAMMISYIILMLTTSVIAVTEWRRPKLVLIAVAIFVLASLYVSGVIVNAGIV